MANQTKTNYIENLPKTLARQSCVKAIITTKLHPKLRSEMERFISQNTISDCNKVAPNCLKAHLIKTAKRLRLPSKKINYLKSLFKSKIGYMGYYLDDGKLKKV